MVSTNRFSGPGKAIGRDVCDRQTAGGVTGLTRAGPQNIPHQRSVPKRRALKIT